jgi:hypothetical protein
MQRQGEVVLNGKREHGSVSGDRAGPAAHSHGGTSRLLP